DLTPDSAAAILRGRWFACARWLGSSMTKDGYDLKWITEDGEIQLLVSIKGDTLEVSASSFPPNEEERAREIAINLYEKIINALHRRKRHFAS
ncbi:hypothetical protein KEJ25_10270, partial [Candidatus Bathyarchaeota archaeon]|nr:hypothetical protein [Candidatus Bathyarchaeota archaeon]